MRGQTFKRCGCPPAYDARGRVKACPKRHGSWAYVVDVGRDPATGKRRQLKRSGFRTQAEASSALAEVMTEVEDGRYRDDGRRTVEHYLREWIEAKVANGLRPTTERGYRQHIDSYLVPHLGHLRLRELRPAHVSRMLRDVADPNAGRARRIGPTSIKRLHATLRSALGDARREGLVKTNAATDATVPRAERPKVRPWEPDELGAFLDYAVAHRLGALFELVALAGLRRGEGCGLRWDDVDVARGILVVRQQVVQVDGQGRPCPVCGREHRGIVIGAPKTSSGDARRVDLGEQGIGVLLAQRFAQDEERAAWGQAYVDHGLVFAREDGNPLAPEQVTKTFGELVRAAGLRRVRLHDLRHGRASLLLAAGVDLAVVSKMLGHSSITITADTYAHLLEGVGRQAAEAADALVPRRRDQSVTKRPSEAAAAVPAEASKPALTCDDDGAPSGTRTPNPLIKSQLLCQLS